jgi:methylase of polypeptide subunit release factors
MIIGTTELQENTDQFSSMLRELPLALAELGYGEFCASFNPLSPRLENWISMRYRAPERLRSALDLFLLGHPIHPSELDKRLRRITIALIEFGLLCKLSTGEVALPNLVLFSIGPHWLFFQKPQANPTLYYGDDSVALMLRLKPNAEDRCLDLCCGPGIQSLQCAMRSQSVVAVEVNPFAAELAKLNICLNGYSGTVEVRCGDLYLATEGETFDLIVANPPLLPFPEDQPYPFVGHGGYDGLRVTRKILSGLPSHLTRNGRAQLIGTCLSGDRGLLCANDLQQIAIENGLDLLFTILAHQPLHSSSQYFEGLVTSALSRTPNRIEVADSLRKHLERYCATHLTSYFLYAKHGTGDFSIQDLSSEPSVGLWYV